RGGHVEYGPAVLDRGDSPGREALPVPEPVHEVDDGDLQVAGEDEVAVQRVGDAILLDRASRGDERLGEDLPPEDAARADVSVAAAIDVHLDGLQIQEPYQVFH